MRQKTLLGGLLAISLLSGCTVVTKTPVTPPSVSNPAPSSGTQQNPGTRNDASPFPRLTNPSPGETLQVGEYYSDATASLRVTGVSIANGPDADQDGAPNYQIQAQVDLGSQGVHSVAIAENDVPASTGGLDSFTVTDLTASSSFTLQLTPDNGNGILESGEAMMSFLFTDDGKVLLNNEQTPVTAEEAAERIATFVKEGQVSPHAVALLYARLLRTEVDTTPQSYNTASFEQWVLGNRLFLHTFLLLILQWLLSW